MSSSAIIPHETVSFNDVEYLRSTLKVATVDIQIPNSVNRNIRTHYMGEFLESFKEGGFDDKMAPIVVTPTQSECRLPSSSLALWSLSMVSIECPP